MSTYLTFLLINWYLVLKQPNYSFLILTKFKIFISGCFVTDNSFNKQNSHTVTFKHRTIVISQSALLFSILNNVGQYSYFILNHYHISFTNKLIQLALLIIFRNEGRSDYQNEEKSTWEIYKKDNNGFSSSFSSKE